MKKTCFTTTLCVIIISFLIINPLLSVQAVAIQQTDSTVMELPVNDPVSPAEEGSLTSDVKTTRPHYTLETISFPDGSVILREGINGSPTPPEGYNTRHGGEVIPASGAVALPDFPSFDWVFGCGAVSGGMVAAYYDRGAFPNIYTGPTNSGVYPITDTSWSTWSDGYNTYPNNPIVASHKGVDGRTTRGSIDDYWVKVNSTAQDPYITNDWPQHTWGEAIGDYMKTSQSAYNNTDGNSWIVTYPSEKLTCSEMETLTDAEGNKLSEFDLNYGSKLFYEARGYSVSECYNQRTDNNNGGFTIADYKAEIDAGHPVMIWVEGHFMVGYGYSGSTIYIRDTWDNDTNNIKSMTWGGSYENMKMLGVAVIHLQTPITYPLNVIKTGSGSGTVTSTPAGINCGGICNASFANGTMVTLTAVPDAESTFSGWSGACSGTNTTCTITMTQSWSVTATFTASTSSTTFADVPTWYWAYDWIERLYQSGITGGCATNPLRYCPDKNVTRAEMAKFILKGKHGGNYEPEYDGTSTGFDDVPATHWAAPWIKQLADEGITTGCGDGNYCPEDLVKRDEMALFILRGMHGSAYQPPPVGDSTGFFDVLTTYWAAAWIKQLAAEEITTGCGGGNYCPSEPVTRAQMAAFLVRAFIDSTPPPPPPPPSDPIKNADFEAGQDGSWKEISSNGYDLIIKDGNIAHSGNWLAWLGGADNEISQLSQTLSIPLNTYYLHFYYLIYSEDVCGYDFARIKVDNSVVHVFDLCLNTKTSGWKHHVVNLSTYESENITLLFDVTTDDTFFSNFFLDTLSLTSSVTAPALTIEPSNSNFDLKIQK